MNITHGLKYHSTNLILYTTEKSNCTVIVSSFLKHVGLLEEALKYSSWVHDYHWEQLVWKRNKDKSLPNMVTLDDLKNKNNIRIKFMRCPYDRAVSSFIHLYRNKIKYCGIDYITLSFNQFLKILSEKIPIRYSGSNIDGHAHTQSFIKEKEFEWDEILKVENPDYNSKLIKEKYGIDLDFNLNSGHWVKNVQTIAKPSGKKISNIPIKDLKINELNYIDFYDEEEKKLVEKIYKIDFDCSNYTFEEFIERNK